MSSTALKLFVFALIVSVLTGCSMIDFPPKMEFKSTWVSKEGKTPEQLAEDRKECSRDAMMASSPAFFGEGRSGGDMKVFDSCMRAKGWVKE